MGKYLASNKRTFPTLEGVCVRIDPFVAILLALTPILQHYRAPIFNAALTVLVVLVPYMLLRTIPKLRDYKQSNLPVVAVMILYLIYRIIDHGTSMTELGQSGVLIIYFLALAFSSVDVKTFCKAGVFISLVASVLLIVQCVSFYVFHKHLQMVPTGLLLPSADQWILGAQTGLAGITGKMNDFYRPSAFFLEPSHVYIYLFPHLLMLLFAGKTKRTLIEAAIVTMGLVLCTSAMGIAFVLGSWALYFVLYDNKTKTFSVKNIIKIRNVILLDILIVIFILAVLYVPTVRRTVTRIFTTGTGVTAITGRISKALAGLENMTFLQWIIGVEDTTHSITYNMPGLVAALYRHGLIGMVMSISICVQALFKLKLPFALVAVVVLATSCFSAHTHSTVGMLYFSFILMYGFQTQRREKRLVRKLRTGKA